MKFNGQYFTAAVDDCLEIKLPYGVISMQSFTAVYLLLWPLVSLLVAVQ